jgi:hypothetical protein
MPAHGVVALAAASAALPGQHSQLVIRGTRLGQPWLALLAAISLYYHPYPGASAAGTRP